MFSCLEGRESVTLGGRNVCALAGEEMRPDGAQATWDHILSLRDCCGKVVCSSLGSLNAEINAGQRVKEDGHVSLAWTALCNLVSPQSHLVDRGHRCCCVGEEVSVCTVPRLSVSWGQLAPLVWWEGFNLSLTLYPCGFDRIPEVCQVCLPI